MSLSLFHCSQASLALTVYACVFGIFTILNVCMENLVFACLTAISSAISYGGTIPLWTVGCQQTFNIDNLDPSIWVYVGTVTNC